jgi:TonB family protein
MKRLLLIAIGGTWVLSVTLSVIAQDMPAQGPASETTSQIGVALTKLTPPIYPPLARQARITGDVKIQVLIRKDGSVESAEVISGHPILKLAALESAQKSQFECRGCAEEKNAYSLTYAFELRDYGDCCNTKPRESEVTQSPGRISIVAPNLCFCDPGAELTKVRSAKCFYLWKCGTRELRVE